MKKILILEDNPAMLLQLSNIAQELDEKNLVFSFDNMKDAYQCTLERNIDLFIVDIILDTSRSGDSSGLKFVENIRQFEQYRFVPVIIVTSLEDAKLYTYESLHCYSFIEKPFDVERLKQTIKQCFDFPGSDNKSKTLYFRKDGIILAVQQEDIVYAESVNHCLYIHTKLGDALNIPYVTLKNLLEDIDSTDFIQCSRNTIINKKYVCNVDIPNQVIQFKDNLGRVDIGGRFKKYVKESFR